LLIALAFLLPNLLGFLVFTAGPIVFSLAMSFTDWALTKHNRFSDAPIRFVGIQNYQRLLVGDESRFFWDYFGNTAYLMIGIPLGIAGSLVLALLLSARLGPTAPRSRTTGAIVAAVVGMAAVAGAWMLTTPGPAPENPVMSTESGLTDLSQWELARLRSNAAVLAAAVLTAITVAGMAIGPVFFRTIFYLPSLLAGVAMFLLWKTLYKPEGGLINAGLRPVLASIHEAVTNSPAVMWKGMGVGVIVAVSLLGARSLGVGAVKLRYRDCGIAAFLGRIALTAMFALVGVGAGLILFNLPAMAAASPDGFDPPEWLVSRAWAKNALIFMGVWLGIGGGNMLLFLAGLSNIPPELYEAGDIDGASGWDRFIHITWPQLAPTTFFIVIMSTIGGLQGGFEQAMVMTQGKYGTTVLAYYLYNLAFTDQFQLGLASAVAWVMFGMIFLMTLFNYRFGSQMTGE
jgi:multiple sugar transport system permease protein